MNLALSLVDRQDLTLPQQMVVADTIAAITPESYSNPDRESVQRKANAKIEAAAASGFTKRQMGEIFATLAATPTSLRTLENYLDITQLVCPDNKTLYRTLSLDEKSALWRFQAALFLATTDSLSSEQRSAVLEWLNLISPELLDRAVSDTELARKGNLIKAAASRLGEVFTPEQTANISLKLGLVANPRGGSARANQRVKMIKASGKVDLRECSCSTNSDWCAVWVSQQYCHSGNCTGLPDGCGNLGFYSCNGSCSY
ncbi:MAG TPA: bacteriocin fulvocin C-related protein [Pyrinomonadaceae bacterium]